MTDLKSSTTLATTAVPALPSKPKKARKVTLIVIGPNGGGVRKTKTTLVVGSVATAARHKVIYVCADSGIGSLSASLKAGGTNHVEQLPEKQTDNYASTLLTIAEDIGADIVIIDLGANELLNVASRRTVRAALKQLRELGHDTYVVLSLVPNKVGLDEDANHFGRIMSGHAEVVLAIHGRDEGADLKAYDELAGDYPSVDVPTDQLGTLGLIAAAGVTHFDWCQAQPFGFRLAAAMTAHNLLQVAQQPIMAEMVSGHLAVPILAELAEGRPVTHYQNRNSAWQVRDECLAADAVEIGARNKLLALGPTANDAAVSTAGRAFIKASLEAKAAHRVAKLAV